MLTALSSGIAVGAVGHAVFQGAVDDLMGQPCDFQPPGDRDCLPPPAPDFQPPPEHEYVEGEHFLDDSGGGVGGGGGFDSQQHYEGAEDGQCKSLSFVKYRHHSFKAP